MFVLMAVGVWGTTATNCCNSGVCVGVTLEGEIVLIGKIEAADETFCG